MENGLIKGSNELQMVTHVPRNPHDNFQVKQCKFGQSKVQLVNSRLGRVKWSNYGQIQSNHKLFGIHQHYDPKIIILSRIDHDPSRNISNSSKDQVSKLGFMQ